MTNRAIIRRMRFVRDRRGVSAVEFALILPFILLLYLGGVELTHAITVDRKVTAATSAVGDLVAQASEVSAADLQNIFDAATAILAPYNAAELKIVVSSVEVNDDGAKVLWSDGRNTSGYEPGTSMALPPGVSVPDTTLIVAEAEFLYQTTLGSIITDSIKLSDIFYLRPRAADEVVRVP
jgi:Flp pilus assembly protein TadG